MQTEDRMGIYCDMCGSRQEGNFTYYSWVADTVSVDISRQEDGLNPIYEHDKRSYDIDVCKKCMDGILSNMKKVIKDRETKQSKSKANEWSSGNVFIRSSRRGNKRG